MRIEILYFSGCPNHSPAAGRVREALGLEGISAEIVEVEINDDATAQMTGFPGSPTIRIDGQDIERSARVTQAFGLFCRTYAHQGRQSGVPPLDWIRSALREAKE